jgi:hypothetical protein
MRERTKIANGVQLKGGMIRRIAITMNEDLFFLLKGKAIESDRSISDQIVRMLKAEVRRADELPTPGRRKA